MKKLLMLAAAASLAATMANAQTTVTTTGAAPAAVQIEPQYRTKIKTYITEHKLRPVQTTEKIVLHLLIRLGFTSEPKVDAILEVLPQQEQGFIRIRRGA